MLDNSPQMIGKAFAEVLKRYFRQTLHDAIKIESIDGTVSVPTFLDRSYHFYEAWIAGTRCVLVATMENTATPTEIAKHISLVRSAMGAIAVFATPSLNARNRSRLIAQGVPFVVPGNQLYIPDLAMDLREYFLAPKPKEVAALSPVAQAVIFHHLLRRDELTTTPSAIAKCLRYSPMSIGRAFDNLVAAGLATAEKCGKERHIRFGANRRELIETVRPLLRTPVRSIKHIVNGGPVLSNLKLAGETALAQLTDLAPPRKETFAVGASDWKSVVETFGLVEGDESEPQFMVETWSYDPAGLSDGSVVDPLSLYVQFHDHQDERIAIEADKLLENVRW